MMAETAVKSVSLPAGLSSAEARRRLQQFGPNRFIRERRGARLLAFARMFADPMAAMLLAAAAVYFALGERIEGFVLLAALVPVLAVDLTLEVRSRAALRALAEAVAPRARVIRDGIETEIATEDIAPGDLLLVREGDVVHADGTLRDASHLSTDESQLTGEAEPLEKEAAAAAVAGESAPDSARVFAGSRVLSGVGSAEVTETGARTRYGAIAALVAGVETAQTPLQRKTGRIVRALMMTALVVSAALLMFRVSTGTPLAQAFLYAITLAMSAVGEEFLLVLTIFLSLGAWRLAGLGVLVRRIASVETLGATTVICLDKTGTLTTGHFALDVHQALNPEVSDRDLLEAAVLACEAEPLDALERAIVEHCAEHQVDIAAVHSKWRIVFDYPFDPAGKHMSHVWEARGAGTRPAQRIVAKGALEGILEHCASTAAERERAHAANAELAARGTRVLGVAGRETDCDAAPFTGSRGDDERGLQLYGLLGFDDPLRPEVPAAIAQCQAAGVKLKLITGDQVLTAHAVAEAAGIQHDDDLLMTGERLDALAHDQFVATVHRCNVFARVRPEQKYAIVEALERAGEVVAMTGDGINDAPALRRADIGVSMGRRGTEVARAAAGLVLLEDDFTALVGTIREGRRIYANIQRAFRYLVGFKVMVIGLALTAPVLGLPILLLPVDLVWLELIVHPISALVFEDRDPGRDLMRAPPRSPASPLLARGSVLRSATCGILLMAGTLALYAARLDVDEAYARGTAITVVVLGSLVLVWSTLAGARPWWRVSPPRDARFWAVIAIVAGSLPLLMYLKPAAALLAIAPIAARDWILAGLIAVAAVAWQAAGTRAAADE
jgi:Ca2+-transporting ATPase